jgi:hypothetical protein
MTHLYQQTTFALCYGDSGALDGKSVTTPYSVLSEV